jgi:hypothetical protein
MTCDITTSGWVNDDPFEGLNAARLAAGVNRMAE